MTETNRTLELNEDLQFQRRTWMAERIAWIAMAVLLLLAASGLFGVGPLSWTMVHNDDQTVQVEYSRFHRMSAPTTFTVTITGAAAANAPWPIELSEEFLQAYKIESIRPEPTQWLALDRGIRVLFQGAGQDSAILYFNLRAERIGYFAPTVTAGTAKPIVLPVLIYP